jgi:hypothetical protein
MKTIISCCLLLAAGASLFAASPEAEIKRGVNPQPVTELNGDGAGKTYDIRDFLCLGKFEASSVEEALGKPFIDESAVTPVEGDEAAGKNWVVYHGKFERVNVRSLPLEKDADMFAVYFSYWIFSPGEIENEKFTTFFYAGSKARFFVNGKELKANKVSNPAEDTNKRRVYSFENMALKEGWNHFLIKLAGVAPILKNDEQDEATLALRITCPKPEILENLTFATAVRK